MVKIFVDSVSDMPDDLLEEYGIEMIPLTVTLGGNSYEDRTVSLKTFFEKIREVDEFPRTAAPSPQRFAEAFWPAIEAGESVICFCLSSASSASYQSATLAADLLREKFPDKEIKIDAIDTKAAGFGISINAIEAAKMAREGKSHEEILEVSRARVPKMKTIVLLDTMEFLHRGGRIGSTTARLASFLGIKPVIEYMASTDGNIELVNRARGFQKGMDWMVKETLKYKKSFENQHLGIAYSTDIEPAEKLKSMLEEHYVLGEVTVHPIGMVVGSHVGPKGVGIFYEAD